MSRLKPLSFQDMSDRQKELFQVISGTRKTGLGGPFSVWLRNPRIAEAANQMHNAFRVSGDLDRCLFEILILLAARRYKAKYVWEFHLGQARKAHVEEAVIHAISEDRRPAFADVGDELFYDCVSEMLDDRTLSEPSYQALYARFGEELAVEIVSAVGFYSAICLLVNAFDVPAPAR